MQQQNDYEELLELARAVVPKTWNVFKYCDVDKLKLGKGILNIEIIISNNPRGHQEPSIGSVGHAEPIYYFNGVGTTKIWLHDLFKFDHPVILLHELAHIIIARRESVGSKKYLRTGYSGGALIEKKMHDKEFWKVFIRLQKKAIRKGHKIREVAPP